MTGLNTIDYMVLSIFGISMLAGFLRGFLKEVISLVTLVAATIISTLFSDSLARYYAGVPDAATAPDASISLVSLGSSFATLFFGTMVAGAIVSYVVRSILMDTGGIGVGNRLLGALFGGARGYLLVIIFMFVSELTPLGSQPAWGESQFVQAFQPVVTWFGQTVDPTLQALKAKAQQTIEGGTGALTNQIQNVGSGLIPPDAANIIKGAMPPSNP